MATRATAASAPSKRFVRVAAVLGLNVLTLGASFTATGTAVDALTSVGVIADATAAAR